MFCCSRKKKELSHAEAVQIAFQHKLMKDITIEPPDADNQAQIE